MGLEFNEVVVLVIILGGFLPVIMALRRNKELLVFFLAYMFLLLGAVFTILEGFFWGDIFHFLEHGLGITLAAFLFLASAYASNKKITSIDNCLRKKIKGGI